MQLGLERIHTILEALVIHVAGTNGKGSVCAYVSSMLTACGISTGRFTSPHLLEPADAISINNIPATEQDIASCRTTIHHLQSTLLCQERLTPFEEWVAIALLYFKQVQVQVAVIEVGVGGRLDATNVFAHPLVCVFVSISMDHMNLLGDTVEKIATEKAGILKQGAHVVVGRQAYPGIQEMIMEKALALQCRSFRLVDPCTVYDCNHTYQLARLDTFMGIKNVEFDIPLQGQVQWLNAAIALATMECIKEDLVEVKQVDKLQYGLRQTTWPGRLQRIQDKTLGVTMIVDGAHNRDSAYALKQYMVHERQQGTRHVWWIMGASQGKAIQEMVSLLVEPGDTVTPSEFSLPQDMPWVSPMPCSEISQCVQEVCPEAHVLDYGTRLSDIIPQLKAKQDCVFVICGSLYLMADYFRIYKKN